MKEVAPPGWGHTKAEKEKTKPNKPKSKIGGSAHEFDKDLKSGKFKGLPGDKTMKDKKASMFKLMWSMKNKGDKTHYKPGEKGVKKEERTMSTRYTKSMADAWQEAMTWKQAQDKDKKDQNKDPVGKKVETYSQRISRDVHMGNESGVGGQTVFVPIEDGVTQQEEKDPNVYDVGDVKQKKGAVAAPGSGTIAKAKKAKASDVNKSLEQQMADAMKEGSRAEAERKARDFKAKKDVASKMGKIRWRHNKGGVPVAAEEVEMEMTPKEKALELRIASMGGSWMKANEGSKVRPERRVHLTGYGWWNP